MDFGGDALQPSTPVSGQPQIQAQVFLRLALFMPPKLLPGMDSWCSVCVSRET